MKICSNCKRELPKTNFSKHKLGVDGLRPQCRECTTLSNLLYDRTKKGLLTKIYNKQKASSKKRGHSLPTYSKQWLEQWLLNNVEYHRLYDMWVLSGYEQDLRPSVNRLDDNLGYTEYNIELITWADNKEKAYKMIRNGGVRKCFNTPVKQFTLDGAFIASYTSFSEAGRAMCVHPTHIGQACDFKWGHNKAKGFLWEK